MAKFEKISSYVDSNLTLPHRKTAESAGYDFEVAEDIIVPSYEKLMFNLIKPCQEVEEPLTLMDIATLVKDKKAKPTLVPTGVKCKLDSGTYLELSVRSSCPLKHWLILANGVGIIDADYYNNPDNEGHIYFQIINLSPYDIQLRKGDVIGQGIIKNYGTTEDDAASGLRLGGFGSTSNG